MLNIKIEENIYTIVNIYAPNDRNNRNTFFKNLINKIETFSEGFISIGGDRNETQKEIDRKSKNKIQKPVVGFKELLKKFTLKDMWREKNPCSYQFTWRRKHINT